jgi:hypothetical protein
LIPAVIRRQVEKRVPFLICNQIVDLLVQPVGVMRGESGLPGSPASAAGDQEQEQQEEM